MMKECKKINLQEPQRNRNATAKFVNLIRTSTVISLKTSLNTNLGMIHEKKQAMQC